MTLSNQDGVAAGPLAVRAKVPLSPRTGYFDDLFVILGMEFLSSHGGSVTLQVEPWGMSGTLVLP
jgi:hypothetical protein